MKFCSECGSPVTLRVPPGDNLPRHVCERCSAIHYQNPKVVAGCIAAWEDRILLCRRAIEPRHGFWTLPAGFMENGETTMEGAARETLEEANARVRDLALFGLYNMPKINQIYVMFRGLLCDLDFSAGEESLEVELFLEQDVPWSLLAFPVIHEALKRYLEDQRNGGFGVHVADIMRGSGDRIDITRH